jgi:hypothetical protein
MFRVFEELRRRVEPCEGHKGETRLCRVLDWASAEDDMWYRLYTPDRRSVWGRRLKTDDIPYTLAEGCMNKYNIERSIFPLFALLQLLPHEVTMIIIVLSFWGDYEKELTEVKD